MKVIFSFTDTPDITALKAEDIYKSTLNLPDAVLHLIGWQERVFAIADVVSQMTDACLYLTCKEMGLKNHPLRTTLTGDENHLYSMYKSAVFVFERRSLRRMESIKFKIFVPILPGEDGVVLRAHGRNKRERNNLNRQLRYISRSNSGTEKLGTYAAAVQTLVDQVLVLLNSEVNPNDAQPWTFRGYHPYWTDSTIIKRHDNAHKRREAQACKAEREAAKRAKQAALSEKSKNAVPHPDTGAGRKVGPIPGEFMGVQFRSQLEIRFATELESRSIRWVYETERLGKGQYLVDFYLPKHGCWVEVKGRFEPRDDYLLKEVAGYLSNERDERLFVYTSSKPVIVTVEGYQKISRDEMWQAIGAVNNSGSVTGR